MEMFKKTNLFKKTALIGCIALVSGFGSTGWCAKIVYPWRATTAIAKTGATFEVWFLADSGQTVNSIQLKGPYNTVNATMSQVSGSWVYDPISGNSYNRKITVTVPSGAPAERYDLVLKTSSGDVTSSGAVKVIKDYKTDYYVVHFSDVHRWQAGYDVTNSLRKVSEILKMASLIDAQMVFETGDNVYTFNRAGREDMYFQGIPSLGIIGHSKTTAATFIVPGNHDTPLNNYELDANPQVCASYWNTYYGLQNHNFKYGNGRFVLFNNVWGVNSAGGIYDYQKNGAVSWLTSGEGAGGNFVMLAAHWTDWFATVDNARTVSMGIYGHSHEKTGNPRDLNGALKGFIAPDLRSANFICNLYRVNNSTGAWTPVSGSGAYVNMLNAGNSATPSTWVLNLTQSYSAANNGTLTNNTATITNRFGFAVSGARVRFVMKRGSYKVNTGTIHQQFDGTLSGANVTVVDVNVDVSAGTTKSVTVSPQVVAQVSVPNVINMTESSAKTSVTGAGLTVSGVSSNYHATVAAGLIYSQTPGGGTLVAPGSSVALAVSKGPSNQPPYFTSNPFSMPDATNGAAYSQSFSAKAVDPEGGTKAFIKVSGPEWLTVTSAGSAQGTPGSVDVGTNSFSVKVTDNGGLSATATMQIKVVSGIPSVGAIVTLKAVNGKYVSATYSTNNTLIADKTTVSNYERFQVINATNCVALKCVGTGKFVGINVPNGSKPMLASRPSIGSYEKFKLVQSGSQIAICSVLTTNYASAISNGVAPLQANQTYIGSYEKFTWKVE